MSKGYGYMLTNRSMPGLVKVGQTRRTPLSRIAELSLATGVPTPFELVYQAPFRDCVAAERAIHMRLEALGFRITPNREFFSAPVERVLAIISEVQLDDARSVPTDASVGEGTATNDSESPDSALADLLIKKGTDYQLGLAGDGIVDHAAAFECFSRATSLGSAVGAFFVARCHRYGQGTRRSALRAIQSYRAAGASGLAAAYAELAEFLVEQGLDTAETVANVRACWLNYFTLIAETTYREMGARDFVHPIRLYMTFAMEYGWDSRNGHAMVPFRDSVLQAERAEAKSVKDPAARKLLKERQKFIERKIPRPPRVTSASAEVGPTIRAGNTTPYKFRWPWQRESR